MVGPIQFRLRIFVDAPHILGNLVTAHRFAFLILFDQNILTLPIPPSFKCIFIALKNWNRHQTRHIFSQFQLWPSFIWSSKISFYLSHAIYLVWVLAIHIILYGFGLGSIGSFLFLVVEFWVLTDFSIRATFMYYTNKAPFTQWVCQWSFQWGRDVSINERFYGVTVWVRLLILTL